MAIKNKLKDKQRLVPQCTGCARNKKAICEAINDPGYIFEHRGSCFARVDKARAQEIEDELTFVPTGKKRRGKRA